VAAEAVATFRREVDTRTREAERYLDQMLPALIAGRGSALTRLAEELDGIRRERSDLGTALAERRAAADRLREVEREVDVVVSRARAMRRS
jgi:hypothetical protein